ncbi:Dyp-type peroxidase [Streptomyces sp. NBC_01363]|uniref:Dyp-type peroxidase n=1 Tax=Streptomyces sp. NBC_01363 TaxID=2903840 RepID=UPI00224C94F9|nr:Dyp-type peroxidase [Streptomyces sp. NBC_01363]MCX4729502.1 Dyp-type peroxidase [Streptomyces sp. NBC_01363]
MIATNASPFQTSPGDSMRSLASLRGSLPAACARVMALDLSGDPSGQKPEALKAAMTRLQQSVAAADKDGVDVWLALGSRVFAGGVPEGAQRPRQLKEMPASAGDLLDPEQSHGDVLVQVTGADKRAVQEAAGQVVRQAAGWRMRWQVDGSRAENRVEAGKGLSRNPFHFTEGFGNPGTGREMTDRAVVRSGQGEPDWAVGGSYQVVRIVRFATELWDKDSIREQERIIGRRRDGRWLDGTPTGEQPSFAADPNGRATPLGSHVRLAAPDRRNPPPLVRRSYNYDGGSGDSGLIFSCFQRDLAKGFEAVQRRLEGEAMAKYILTTGGGYFFVPPPGDAWIDALFAQATGNA